LNYTVQGRAGDGSIALNVTLGKWTTSTWMSNLQNLLVWTFNVTACNEVGCGGSSAPSSGVVPAEREDPPDAVTGLAASPAVRAVTLGWTHPANSVLWSIVNYTIVVQQGGSVVQLFNVSGVAGDRGCTVQNLAAGQLFEFVVFAWNVNGAGANASTTGRPASRETPPDAPFSVIATTAGGTVIVTWHMPHDFGGATALSNCSVFVAPSAASAPPAVVPYPSSSTSFVNLIDNVGYSLCQRRWLRTAFAALQRRVSVARQRDGARPADVPYRDANDKQQRDCGLPAAVVVGRLACKPVYCGYHGLGERIIVER
jgi:hypothetical protein